jgi:indolepyruvate ferredoxin oxidoreductase
MFEGNYSIKYHLAPPLLSRRDSHGHLVKRQFGSWVGMVFPLLAKLRFLRGSLLDPFGYTEERKGERALIAEYRDTIASLLPQLSSDNLSQMVELAGIPEDIRGYGHVKERHLKNAKQKEARLLDVLKSGAKPAPSSGRHAA